MTKESYRLNAPDRLEERVVPAAIFADYPVLPAYDAATLGNVRQIAYRGQLNGLRQDAFLAVGDSNTDTDIFLRPLGSPTYNPTAAGLTAFGSDLVDTWATFRSPIDASGNNSFSRHGDANHRGWTTNQMLSKLPQEIAETHAGVALILAGTNDIHVYNNLDYYRSNLRAMIDTLSDAGIVPILSTIPRNRFFGEISNQRALATDQVIAEVADEKRVPLLNLWRAVEPLPYNGIDAGNVHLNSSPYTAGGLNPVDLLYGQNVRTLITLQALSQVRHLAFAPPAAVEASANWQPLKSGQAVFATGSDLGSTAVVTVQDAATGRVLDRIVPFGSSFRGGVNVALGDLNGDGVPDIVAAPGLGGGPVIRVYSGLDGHELSNFYAFEPDFRGGVTVAVGDANGDGTNAIVVGTGVGGAPRVRVFRSADGAVTADFFAFDSGFRNGVTVAVGSSDGGWIAAGAGVGGSPTISIFAGKTGELLKSVAAFDPSLRGGVNVAAGDVTGDGRDDLIAGSGLGSAPLVEVIDPASLQIESSFYAGDPAAFDGVRVAVVRGSQGIVAAPGRGFTRGARLFGGDGTERLSELAADRGIEPFSGIYVGG